MQPYARDEAEIEIMLGQNIRIGTLACTATKPLKVNFKPTLSNICRILNIVALCVQQIFSMFRITPVPVFNSRLKRLFIFKESNPL